MPHAAELSPAEESECYHCGLPVPPDSHYYVLIDGQRRRMCCAGCEAVAESIVASGLTEYYRHRDALPESRREAMPVELQQLGLFDNPDFQKSFVRPVGEHEREASLILEGITCAACVWLNEQHISRQPGVLAVDINYATRRARVRWDAGRIQLSQILAAIQAIGYRAYPYDAERSEQLAGRERRAALWRLFVAGFGMMQVMMYAIPAYLAGDGGDMSTDTRQLLRWASLVLTLPVVGYAAAPFFRHAWRDLRLRRLGMDVPVAVGIGSAFAASCWATFTGGGEVYFDSVAMFVFFLLCGRYLEMLARQRAVRGVEELGKVLPAFAERLPAWPDLAGAEDVAVSVLQPGDVVRVKPGESFPADALVLDGESAANEALLTGESRAVPKQPGSQVIGGSVNVSSPLVLRVEQVGDSTRLAAIQRLMERAAAEKPRIVELADWAAGWFVAAVLVLALGAAAYWSWQAPARALWVFVSVLVVSCPCALSLATPVALTVGTDRLARLGVLVTRGHAIETLARATHFVFDKTGTLTYGKMHLASTWVPGGGSSSGPLALAVALEGGSEHAIAQGLRAASLPASQGLSKLRAVTGRGVEASVEGRRWRLGRQDFVAELVAQPLPPDLPGFPAEATVVVLGSETGWSAWFCLQDALRADAVDLLDLLRRDGRSVSILSGDTPEAVAAVAQQLGVENACGGMLPEDKRAHIEALQRQGAVVAMIGDGVNDAPVLAQAHVSIAMGGGPQLARNQGDIVLLSDSLTALGRGLKLARRILTITRENLGWAFAYNVVALPLAISGVVTPWMAGIGMSASSLMVVLNALRLQRSARGARSG